MPKGWGRRRRAKETDWGRRYGWYIEKDSERIGELEYLRWDSDSQFWHEYRVRWASQEASALGCDPDAWIKNQLSLRNQHLQDVVVTVFLTAIKAPGVIAVYSARVPEDKL